MGYRDVLQEYLVIILDVLIYYPLKTGMIYWNVTAHYELLQWNYIELKVLKNVCLL